MSVIGGYRPSDSFIRGLPTIRPPSNGSTRSAVSHGSAVSHPPETVFRMGKVVNMEQIGTGAYSDVYRVRFIGSQRDYAVKVLKSRFESRKEIIDNSEVRALYALRGIRNIIRLETVDYDPDTHGVALIFEMMDLDLCALMKQRNKFSEGIAVLYLYQVLSGLSAMHQVGMFHRDVKPENILIRLTTHEVKLVDLGSARVFAGATGEPPPYTDYTSTRWYRSPEVLLTSGWYGPSMDLWAVGCLGFEMLTGKALFPGETELEMIDMIHQICGTPDRALLRTLLSRRNDHLMLDFPDVAGCGVEEAFSVAGGVASPQFMDFLQHLITYDESQRFTADQALGHPIFDALRRIDLEWSAIPEKRRGPFGVYAYEALRRAPVSRELSQARQRAGRRAKEFHGGARPQLGFVVKLGRLIKLPVVRH